MVEPILQLVPAGIALRVNGEPVTVPEDAGSLLDALRDHLGLRSAKDGCSPQGQCGCCTVWVDGAPRVACVTPVSRVAGREITTLEGLPGSKRDEWTNAFTATGASQCGFCTPGIIMRVASLAASDLGNETVVGRALLAHRCRCTGWRTIFEACALVGGGETHDSSSRELAANRAGIEGGVPQRVGAHVAAGAGGFADDTAPGDALVAVPSSAGWAVGPTVAAARAASGKTQGRRSTVALGWPLEVPDGKWALTLRTTWVEPAYLETDASWCRPGGTPADPVANGGAFGGKTTSPLADIARSLADERDCPVRALWSREDTVRWGPKRPPVAAGVRADGSGVVRVVRTEGIAEMIASVAPSFEVEQVDVAGPPTSAAVRAAGWAEAAILLAGLRGDPDVEISAPNGARARATVTDELIRITIWCGDPLDEVVLRSYCIGAAHMALGWVTSEGISVGTDGEPHDLTIRSFGILRATEMLPVEVEIEPSEGRAVNGSDAVFAAVAAAAWIAQGCPQDWPTRRAGR